MNKKSHRSSLTWVVVILLAIIIAAMWFSLHDAITLFVLLSLAFPFLAVVWLYQLSQPIGVTYGSTLVAALAGVGAVPFIVHFVNAFVGVSGQLSYAEAALVSVVEETSKGIIALIIIFMYGEKSLLRCLLIGAAVGAGFAFQENLYYVFERVCMGYYNAGIYDGSHHLSAVNSCLNEQLFEAQYPAIKITALLRSLYSLVHVAFTALVAGGFALSSRVCDKLSISNLVNPLFLSFFVLSLILHWLYNAPLLWSLKVGHVFLKPIVIVLIAWSICYPLIRIALSKDKTLP